jgi:hypothetical protein
MEKIVYQYYKYNSEMTGIDMHEWRVLLLHAEDFGHKERYIANDELFSIEAQSNTGAGQRVSSYGTRVELRIGDYHSPRALKLLNKIAPKLNWYRGGRTVMRALKALKIERVEYVTGHDVFVPRKLVKKGLADLWIANVKAGFELKAA